MSILELFGVFVIWFIFIPKLLIGFLLPLIKYVYILYWPKRKYFNPNLKPKTNNNSWAIVTGGTDGIGLEYCRLLLEYGYCLFIISRSKIKLELIKQQLLDEYSSFNLENKICIVPFDFSEPFNVQNYEQLEKSIQQLSSVEILVNNVGISFKTAEFFTNIVLDDPKFHQSLINVNIGAILHMTRICLPLMIKQNHGIIINIR